VILSSVSLIVLFIGITAFYTSNSRGNDISNENTVARNRKIVSKKRIDKRQAEKINNKFYDHKLIHQEADMALVGYPSTFSELVDSGELTVDGEVTGLQDFVYENHPYTVASIFIESVLHGNNSQSNKTIRVMFMGGNITKKQMLAPVADKSFMNVSADDLNSSEVVTVEYGNNRLPRAGDQIALVLDKAPSGANKIPGEFWSPKFADKGTFFKNSNGQYKRTPEAKSVGGNSSKSATISLDTIPSSNDQANGESQNEINRLDDEKMNSGMNRLINKK